MITSNSDVKVRSYATGDQPAFKALNEAWINRFFTLEAKDREILDNPETAIIGKGGRILFVCVDGTAVGCCALIPMGQQTYEVSKMGVSEEHQGLGLGRKVLIAAIDTARDMGAHRLFLETNRKLAPAIRLYESVGFVHMAPESVAPSAYARADVAMEMIL